MGNGVRNVGGSRSDRQVGKFRTRHLPALEVLAYSGRRLRRLRSRPLCKAIKRAQFELGDNKRDGVAIGNLPRKKKTHLFCRRRLALRIQLASDNTYYVVEVVKASNRRSRRTLRYGFAAGCEAAALPRRRCAFYILGCALRVAYGPSKFPDHGHSPVNDLAAVGVAKPPPHTPLRSRACLML